MLRPRKASLLFLALGASSVALAAEYKPGEVIVRYKDGTLRSRASMDVLYDSVGVQSVRHYAGIMKGFEQLILNDNVKVQDAIAELQKNPAVAYAQPNYILHALPIQVHARNNAPRRAAGEPCLFPGIPFPPGCDDSEDPVAPSPVAPDPGTDPGTPSNPNVPSTPNASIPEIKTPPDDVEPPVADPDLAKAYGVAKIGATNVWQSYRGTKDFIVADIDTGIDYNHPDLSFNIWRNPNPDKKDYVGFNFVSNDPRPFDDNGHGTHTAGTIGAVGGNGVGISGVAQRVSLMSLKFLSGDGSGTSADAIRAIDYAIAHGAKVLSNSWGGQGSADDPENKALYDAIDRAKAKDVLFIAAAGNDGVDNDGSSASYPAAFSNDNIIAVAATDKNDSLAWFSNYGKKTTHLAAPGVDVYSTVPGGKYKNLSGTSMACPHVAGAAALLWSKHPDWNYKKVKEVLMSSTDQIAGLESKTVTGGRLNIQKALSVE